MSFVSPYDVLETRALGDDAHLLLRPLVFASEALYAYRATLPGAAGWDEVLTVPQGFVTDFMSIPRWLPLTFALMGGTAARAGVVHDFLYQTHLVPRAVADDVLSEAIAACEPAAWRHRLAWCGVRVGGAAAYETGPLRKRVFALQTIVDPMGEA